MSQIITELELLELNPALDDALAELVAGGVNAWIENVTSRSWGDEKTVTELYNASGVVWLRHMDVTEVVSVKTGYPNETKATLDASTYYCTPQGRLVLSRGRQTALPPSTLDYIEVNYKYGVAPEDIPSDLTMAAMGIAMGYADWVTNSGKDVSRAQVGSYTLEFSNNRSGDPVANAKVNRDMQVVNSYALRRV